MLVGFSSGALRAALFAQHHPDRVKRLALDAMVYTGKGSPTLKKRAEKLAQWKSSVTRPIDPAFLMSTMTRDHSETAMESRKKPYVDAILAIETTVPNGTYIDMCENLPVCDPKQIKVPTAILRGQYDGIASDEDLLEFFRLLPNPDKEFVMMPGIAHAAATSKNYLRFYDAMYRSSRGPRPCSRADRRKLERGIDQRGGALEIVVAVDVLLHQERDAAVELLVLLVAAAELGAEEIPGEPHQRRRAISRPIEPERM